jgi:enediyne biosynthesis protein E4
VALSWLALFLAAAAAAPKPIFVEAAQASGLDFVHFNGMSGQLYYCEMIGPGAALFDYDNDGDLDVFTVQGTMLGEGKTLADAVLPPRTLPLGDRLWRNDLEVRPDGTRTLHFTDVTQQAGIAETGYGMGVAAGDYDNDGWVDLYVTNYGADQMWHNNGDGTFTDVTAKTGTSDDRWSTSAAFVDIDRDGWLDLYVANYVDYRIAASPTCRAPTGRPDYCGPHSFHGEPDRLYRNRGDGSFEDVSAKSGILSEYGAGLGVATADYDGDGWPDIFVANDGEPNFLWINRHDGTFRNDALLAGCAVNRDGQSEAGMGVDAGDFDNDGDEDVFITHLLWETNTLYVNDRHALFEDRTARSRLGPLSKGSTGFGTAWLDWDNDGWLDLVIANGSVTRVEALVQAGDPFPLSQKNKLLRNRGDGTFEEAGQEAGPAFELCEVSRGVAVGDVDNDGDTDVLVMNNSGPARLLLDQVGQSRPWLGLRLVDAAHHRDQLGARVTLLLDDGTALVRRAHSDGSYLSAGDPRVLFGLGRPGAARRVRVAWPDGRVEEWDAPPEGRYTTLVQGTGRPGPGS